VLRSRGETAKSIATAIGYSPGSVRQVLDGNVMAWPKFRRRLAEYLDLPESVLFRDGGA
jgi:hypothetical protein